MDGLSLGALAPLAGLNPDVRAASVEADQAVALAQRAAAVAAAELDALAWLPVRRSKMADPRVRSTRRPAGVLGFVTDLVQGLDEGVMAPVREAVSLFPGWALVDRGAWIRSLRPRRRGCDSSWPIPPSS